MIESVRNKVRLVAARCLVKLTDSSLGVQSAQVSVLKGELRSDVENFQHYGLTSRPAAGTEGVLLCIGGNRDHGILIATENRAFRLKDLEEGEVALYTDEGDKIHFLRGQEIRIESGVKVRVEAPDAEFSGDVLVEGNVVIDGHLHVKQTLDVDGTSDFNLAATFHQHVDVISDMFVNGPLTVTFGIESQSGDIKATSGNVQDIIRTNAADRALYNVHFHTTGAVGFPTSGPNPFQ